MSKLGLGYTNRVSLNANLDHFVQYVDMIEKHHYSCLFPNHHIETDSLETLVLLKNNS